MNTANNRKATGEYTSTMGGDVAQVVEALRLASAGMIAEARLIAESLTDDADREAVEQGIRAAIRDQRRRKLDANREAARMPKPPEVNENVRSWVRLAQGELDKARALAFTNPKKNRTKIQQHEATAKRLLCRAEEHARDEADRLWIEGALAETQVQAELRGQAVAVSKTGPATTTEKTGLEDAKAKGYLEAEHGPDRSEDLYRTGVRYREAYEIARGQTTSKGDGGGGFGPKGPQLRIVEAGEDLATMRSALTMKEAAVLDSICGEGLGLFQTTIRCRMGTPAVRRALRGGLTLAMEALQARRKRRQDSPEDITSAERVKGASDAVDRAAKGL